MVVCLGFLLFVTDKDIIMDYIYVFFLRLLHTKLIYISVLLVYCWNL